MGVREPNPYDPKKHGSPPTYNIPAPPPTPNDAKDATIAELRAKVERTKEQLETARMLKHDACRLCDEARTELQTLKGELTQLREDRRVLGAEVRSWRYQCVQENTEGGDADGATCRVNAAMEATDASKALERANG